MRLYSDFTCCLYDDISELLRDGCNWGSAAMLCYLDCPICCDLYHSVASHPGKFHLFFRVLSNDGKPRQDSQTRWRRVHAVLRFGDDLPAKSLIVCLISASVLFKCLCTIKYIPIFLGVASPGPPLEKYVNNFVQLLICKPRAR